MIGQNPAENKNLSHPDVSQMARAMAMAQRHWPANQHKVRAVKEEESPKIAKVHWFRRNPNAPVNAFRWNSLSKCKNF